VSKKLSQFQNMNTNLHRHNSIEKSQDIQTLPKFKTSRQGESMVAGT
jgi:hypothetical protein